VSLYVGQDPLTGRRLYQSETLPSEAEAKRALTRLRAARDQKKTARTRVPFSMALDEWMLVQELGESTRDTYERYLRLHIRPALGHVPISQLTPQMLERFYAELRRCRARCRGKGGVDHRTAQLHECEVVRHRRPAGRPSSKAPHDCVAARCTVVRCPPHECRPLAAASITKIHFMISGACAAALRWGWIHVNPASVARHPRVPPPQPNPPTSEQAARILAAAWEESPAWGTLVWLVMVTGLRRGELCALRWSDVDFDTETLVVRRGLVVVKGRAFEKDTKTHRMRRIALDAETVKVLQEHRAQWDADAEKLDIIASDEAYLFSHEPDQSRPYDPNGVTHRYGRMCAGLGIDSHLHALRHYSATELLSAGVDLRTVAGRLGHGGGGVTTLRVYAAFVAESDRRASQILGSRFERPRGIGDTA
jgi:integrase